MPLDVTVLGGPRTDNALFVRVRTGQATHRLLFDCGEGCLRDLPRADVQETDHLLFSHLHMDHVAGFDSFFRVNAARERPVRVWGPPGTSDRMHHRLRGVMWNLHAGLPGTWEVRDIHEGEGRGARFLLREAFEVRHDLPNQPTGSMILDGGDYTVEAHLMDHRTPSAAYVVREAPRVNVDVSRLRSLGLTGGPWLQALKSGQAGPVEVGGRSLDLADLRRDLLVETPGESVAYLTDFLLDDGARERLVPALRGVTTLVCESQYRHADAALARENHHMTAVQAAGLAREAGVGRLVLFHVSERYAAVELPDLLAEARAVFPATEFPEGWSVQG